MRTNNKTSTFRPAVCRTPSFESGSMIKPTSSGDPVAHKRKARTGGMGHILNSIADDPQ